MKLREIPCPAFNGGHPVYQPGDCWFARPTTEAERAAAAAHQAGLQKVAGYRWAWWADRDRLLNDSEIAAEHAGRQPLIAILPNGHTFVTTQPVRASSTIREWHRRMDAWTHEAPDRTFDQAYDAVLCPAFEQGWTIGGEGIALTLSPSIHYDPGGPYEWHGFLVSGELR
jgi:hypothetical protein